MTGEEKMWAIVNMNGAIIPGTIRKTRIESIRWFLEDSHSMTLGQWNWRMWRRKLRTRTVRVVVTVIDVRIPAPTSNTTHTRETA